MLARRLILTWVGWFFSYKQLLSNSLLKGRLPFCNLANHISIHKLILFLSFKIRRHKLFVLTLKINEKNFIQASFKKMFVSGQRLRWFFFFFRNEPVGTVTILVTCLSSYSSMLNMSSTLFLFALSSFTLIWIGLLALSFFPFYKYEILITYI